MVEMSACIYVLDTNVLIHDPNALLRFDEHDVVLPIVVFEASERSRLAAHVAEVL